MNHGAAALLVYGNYSMINKDLDGVIGNCTGLSLRRYPVACTTRFRSLLSKGMTLLYCAAFIPQWQQLGFHFTKGERRCIVWFFLLVGRP
jgi:hypothetical protein